MTAAETDPVLAAIDAFKAVVAQAKADGISTYPELQAEHLSALGCPYAQYHETAGCDIVYYTALNKEYTRSFVAAAPALLAEVTARIPDDALGVTSLLGGLARSGCWRACLTEVETAHSLAVAICYFIDTYSDECALDAAVESDVLDILNDWLKPTESWIDLPPVLAVTTALFGSWWCDIALDSIEQDAPGSNHWADGSLTASAVAKDRPPFMPTVRPELPDIELAHLPDLGML
jgi:hypothetical protein